MSKIVLSSEQRRASECLDRNVLLFAGAGCGKTATVVERYVNILKARRVDVSSIAAITFTEKAANELRQRIRKRFLELLQEAGDPLSKAFWRDRLLALDAAAVSTIHGFCESVLREFPIEAGLDPGFTVIDDKDGRRLASSSVESAIHKAVMAGDAAVARVLERVSLSNLTAALTAALNERETIDVFLSSIEVDWRDASGLGTVLRAASSIVVRLLITESLSSMEFLLSVSRLKSHPGPKGDRMEEKRAAFLAAFDYHRSAERDSFVGSLRRMRDAIGDLRGGSKKKWGEDWPVVNTALKIVAKRVRDAEELQSAVEDESWESRAFDMSDLFHLCHLALGEYNDAKRVRAGVDFDDLLILARNLLRDDSGVAAVLAERYRYLLVDEFQDTDHVQEEIINSLAERGSNVFVVGDPQQSIYGWRGAEVEVFSKVAERYQESGAGLLMNLTGNYRAQPHVLAFVNGVFSSLMSPGSGMPMWRTSHTALSAERPHHARTVEVFLARSGQGVYQSRRIEAEMIASRIREMVECGGVQVFERDSAGGEKPRAAQFGDVAILMRSMSSVGIYERALRKAEVPFYTLAGTTFYLRQEVRDVVNMLRFVVDGDDSLSLVGALRSPLFGVSDDYLALLTGDHRLTDYFGPGVTPPGEGPDHDALVLAVDLVGRLRRHKSRLGARELLDVILDKTGFLAAEAMLFDGPQRVANVMSLADAASEFDARHGGSLEDFVRHTSELELAGARESEAVTQDESGNVVRIMTVHAAKGLEFPIVVLADTSRSSGADRAVLRADRTMGICMSGPEKTGLDKLMRSISKDRDAAEEKRVFFVAATRARDHLILSGSAKDKPSGWLQSALESLGIDIEELNDVSLGEFDLEYSLASSLSPGRPASGQPLLKLHDDLVSGKRYSSGGSARNMETAARIAPVTGTIALRDRFTATEIGDFLRCPLRFELGHLRGLPSDLVLGDSDSSESVPGYLLGTLLHEVLAGARPGESLDEALQRVLTGDAAYDPYRDALLRDAAEILERVGRSKLYSRLEGEREGIEAPFSFLFDGALLEGKIDRVLGTEVVDFKSDDVSERKARSHADRYRGQMDVYALAFARMRGVPPERVTLYFLRPDIEVSWEYGGDGMGEAEHRVREVICGIRKGPPYEFDREAKCWCEYASLCRLISARRST